jgi:acetate kinase
MTTILTVNAGSSSIRLGLFTAGAGDSAAVRVRTTHAASAVPDAATLAGFIAGASVDVVVHRVVHGGPRLRATCLLDDATTAEIERATPLAPLHNPAALAWARLGRQQLPGPPALAAFDTGFFATLPPVAATYALPAELRAGGDLGRLGFHGFAHRSMWDALRALAPARAGRVISFQLGGGCSVAALRDGVPVDTSMGFTPTEGLVMATRSGDLDPGLVLHLLRDRGLDAAELDRILSERSGLAGLADGRSDVRALLEAQDPAARLALDVYGYRARKYLGAYVAALGGCDAVLFGGGAGEHAPALRHRILAGLEVLGIELDDGANASARAPARITKAASRVDAWVVPTDEETVLAREALAWTRGPRR